MTCGNNLSVPFNRSMHLVKKRWKGPTSPSPWSCPPISAVARQSKRCGRKDGKSNFYLQRLLAQSVRFAAAFLPQNPLPNNVSGFKRIFISYIDRNAIDFLHRFRPIFAACQINLSIDTMSDRISEFILRNIWPMIAKNICGMLFFAKTFQSCRKFATSILNDCPSLRFVAFFFDECFPEFSCDDSAAASDGQAVAKWLFTPCPDNVPKPSRRHFASASSPVNFIVVISFINWSFADSVVPFNVTNELTREQLALKRINNSHRFVLIRCPIERDADKWTKWEEEAIGRRIFDQWNQIEIQIYEEKGIGDGLLDAMVGPSDH
ncbi:hypothetical protein niasHT_039065 [Heterodera trifolii]|uniref:Uncharacterized protein n=1 Tax=Heterodera trifolii TaxID=157864 RepID=A0ABD2HRK2_9BILA